MLDSQQPSLKRILVIRIGRLGDTLLATPVIEVLRNCLGASVSIDFVCSPGASAFILGLDKRVNRVFAVAHRSIPWRLHPIKRELKRHSRGSPYDLVINLECGSTHPELLQKTVLENNADLGIALDGDGDRVLMVDHEGRVIDGDELLYVMAKDRVERSNMQGGVIGTVMTNLGLEHAFKELGVEFERAKVGDRYIMEMLLQPWLMQGKLYM